MMQKVQKRIRNKKGFTLVELIVVIAILAILVMIAVPRFGSATEAAEIRTVQSNHRTLVSASQMYYAQNLQWPGVDEQDADGNVDMGDNVAWMNNFVDVDDFGEPGTYELGWEDGDFTIRSWHGGGDYDDAPDDTKWEWTSATQ